MTTFIEVPGQQPRKAYQLFLDFLGLELRNDLTGEVGRVPGGEWRLVQALVQNVHNQLRVRRVLASLAVTGSLGQHFLQGFR